MWIRITHSLKFIFHFRFDCFIHNASHIIIPLLKQNIFLFCNKCQAIFTSQDDLNTHYLNEHPKNIIIKQEIHENNEEFNLNKVKKEPFEDIDSFPICKESIKNRLKFEDEDLICNGILKDFVTECKVNVQICDEWSKLVKPYSETSLEHSFEGNFRNLDKKSLADKLVLDEPLTDEYSADNFVLNTFKSDNDNNESIHYDNLMKPGIYNCKYCTIFFPNR